MPSDFLLMWADLSPQDTRAAIASDSSADCVSTLKQALSLDDSPEANILLDMFHNIIKFSREHGFSDAQTSALLSLLKRTHGVCTSTQLDNFSATLEHFKTGLLRHSVHRPGFSEALFSLADCSEILSYALQTYFRHFKLYKFVFAGPAQLALEITYPVPTPTPPKPDPADIAEANSPSPARGSHVRHASTPKAADASVVNDGEGDHRGQAKGAKKKR